MSKLEKSAGLCPSQHMYVPLGICSPGSKFTEPIERCRMKFVYLIIFLYDHDIHTTWMLNIDSFIMIDRQTFYFLSKQNVTTMHRTLKTKYTMKLIKLVISCLRI